MSSHHGPSLNKPQDGNPLVSTKTAGAMPGLGVILVSRIYLNPDHPLNKQRKRVPGSWAQRGRNRGSMIDRGVGGTPDARLGGKILPDVHPRKRHSP